ncbi:MAG: phosphodiester glycosidase family protein [Deinococcales bacterium]
MTVLSRFSFLCLLFCLYLNISQLNLAQAQEYYRLPGVQLSEHGFSWHYGPYQLDYDYSQGWSQANGLPTPYLSSDGIYLPLTTLRDLGVYAPVLSSVRYSHSDKLRIVFDLDETFALEAFRSQGVLKAQEPVSWQLPAMLLPLYLPLEFESLKLQLESKLDTTNLSLTSSTALSYELFSLNNPKRLVLDVRLENLTMSTEQTLISPLAPTIMPSPVTASITAPIMPSTTSVASSDSETGFALRICSWMLMCVDRASFSVEDSLLHPAVRYRRFYYPHATGESAVYVLELNPKGGSFRVVGEASNTHKLSELASGAFAAINAGYFDPDQKNAIGFLKIAGATLSDPSRNRASIAFGSQGVLIDRIRMKVAIAFNRQWYAAESYNLPSAKAIYDKVTSPVGSLQQAVILVQDGKVIDHRIGPLAVPKGAYALIYEPNWQDPDFPSLARVNIGDEAQLRVQMSPASFNDYPYAVEAGPLLLYQGQDVYEPSLENFQNSYIVNGRTQQSAVGVRPDGTVLFVIAEALTAHELVPLFKFLGADRAMRFDSGSSATLFAGGRVLNRSSERNISSAIVFITNP